MNRDWPEKPWDYTPVHIPTAVSLDGPDVILLGGGPDQMSYDTSSPSRLPPFDIRVGETKVVGGYTFTLLAVDDEGAFLRTTDPRGRVHGRSNSDTTEPG